MGLESRILIVGGDSNIGSALRARLTELGFDVIATSRRSGNSHSSSTVFLDLANPDGWTAPGGISTSIFCAAVTSTQKCKQEPQESRRINIFNTEKIAGQLAAGGSRIIFLSTNLVFDGLEPYKSVEAPVCPTTEYGFQKAEAERRLLGLGDATCVARLTKVICATTALIVQWKESLQKGLPIHPFSDMVFSPIPLNFLSDALIRLIEKPYSGIIQISGAADISYLDFAKQLASRLQADAALVQPALASQLSTMLEPPPAHTVLDSSTLRAVLGMEPPDVSGALASVLSGVV